MSDDDSMVVTMATVGVGFILIGLTGTIMYHWLFTLFAISGGLMAGYFIGWSEYDRTVTGKTGGEP